MKNINNIKKHFYISLGIFVLAICCPVFYGDGTLEIIGFQSLVLGWIPFFTWIARGNGYQIGFSSISWFANFFIIAAWYLRNKSEYIESAITSGIALLLSLLVILESVIRINFYKLGVGYLLWVSSFLYFFVATIVLNYNIKKEENNSFSV